MFDLKGVRILPYKFKNFRAKVT